MTEKKSENKSKQISLVVGNATVFSVYGVDNVKWYRTNPAGIYFVNVENRLIFLPWAMVKKLQIDIEDETPTTTSDEPSEVTTQG